MNYIKKKIVAREIIIFFSTSAITIICILFLWLYNQNNKSQQEELLAKRNKLIKEINQLDSQSIVSLNELIDSNLPIELMDKIELNELNKIPSPNEVYSNDTAVVKFINIRKLFIILEFYQFNFKDYKMPLSYGFEAEILTELNNIEKTKNSDINSSDILNQIHKFLNEKIKIKVNYHDFIFSILNKPNPYSNNCKLLLTKKEVLQKTQEDINELEKHIFSYYEQMDLYFWILLSIFIVIYPVRGIILSIRWAIKTLRH